MFLSWGIWFVFGRWKRRQMHCRLPCLCLGQAVWPKGQGGASCQPGGGGTHGAGLRLCPPALGPPLTPAALPATALFPSCLCLTENSPEACKASRSHGQTVPDTAVISGWKIEFVLPLFLLSCIRFSDSGMRALSYRAQWRLNVTISKASAGKKTWRQQSWGEVLLWHIQSVCSGMMACGNGNGAWGCHWESSLEPAARCTSFVGRKCTW